MTFEEKKAEEYICNGKCQDDITKNYVHCKTCGRIKDFVAGYREALKMKVNTTTISDAPLMEKEQLEQAKEIIRELVGIIDYLNEDEYVKEDFPIIHKAEQFLKENKSNIFPEIVLPEGSKEQVDKIIKQAEKN